VFASKDTHVRQTLFIAAWFAAFAPLASASGGCTGPQCENKAFFGLPSPDGTSIAFVFYRKCAPKMDITTDVTVLDFHSPLRNEPGNVLAVANEQPVRVSWLGPHKLVVTGFVEPIYRRNSRVGSITIEFRPENR
jgi:hypothetical protein